MLAGVGARDGAVLGAMAQRMPGRIALVWVAALCAFASAALAAMAASWLAPQMVPDARMMLAAFALGLAGVESLLTTPARRPVEPTRSLGAFALVIFAHQITDSARFLVFALAVAFAAPMPTAGGGAAGGAAMLALAWSSPDLAGGAALLRARRLIGVGLLVLALVIGFGALPG